MIYAATGTLNMADLAERIPEVPSGDLAILHGGAAILGTAFLVKSGIWPLSFWLSRPYAPSAPPVAALVARMPKLGHYVITRRTSLLFGDALIGGAGFPA